MSRVARLTAFAMVAALTIGACGSSYKGLSKAEFVRQATAICTKGDAKLTRIGDALGDKPTLAQLKDAYAKQLVPALKDEAGQLRALKPPKADRKTVSKIFDDLGTGIDQAAATVKTLRSVNDLAALPEPAALKAANTEAKAYGLGKCAESN